VRGGSFNVSEFDMQSSARGIYTPSEDFNFIGFRVASVPEPSTGVLSMLTGLGLIGLAWRRRLSAI
jgi:hypothetical protein